MKKNNSSWLWLAAVVAAFGVWHFLDVRAGALESRDTWLMTGYLCLGAMVIFCLWAIGWFLWRPGHKGGISLERIYLVMGLSFGILCQPLTNCGIMSLHTSFPAVFWDSPPIPPPAMCWCGPRICGWRMWAAAMSMRRGRTDI